MNVRIIHFYVQGSQPHPYSLSAKRDGHNFTFTCSCPAGEVGQICRHRLSLLAGDIRAVVEPNTGDLEALASMWAGSTAETALAQIQETEREIDVLKKRLSSEKKKLARIFNQ